MYLVELMALKSSSHQITIETQTDGVFDTIFTRRDVDICKMFIRPRKRNTNAHSPSFRDAHRTQQQEQVSQYLMIDDFQEVFRGRSRTFEESIDESSDTDPMDQQSVEDGESISKQRNSLNL